MGTSSFVIGISGLSGAGKTFFIQKLKLRLGANVAVISFDDYYKPMHEQAKDMNGITNFDLPSALYHQKFTEDLLKLTENHPILLKRYNFENYDAPERIDIVEPAPVIIAEGLFVFDFPLIDSMLDYRIFLEAGMNLSLQRRLLRDIEERGIPEERSLYQWHNHVMPAYENHIFPHRNRCQLIIENKGIADENIELIMQHIYTHAAADVVDRMNRQ